MVLHPRRYDPYPPAPRGAYSSDPPSGAGIRWWSSTARDSGIAIPQAAPCPVRLDCLRFALGRGWQHDIGVWGGTSEQQRRRAREKHLTAEELLAKIDAKG